MGKDQEKNSILHTAHKALYVIDTDTGQVVPFADSVLFKSTRFSSIRYYRDRYQPDYWNDLNLSDSLSLGKKIRTDLELTTPLSRHLKKQNLPSPEPYKAPFSFEYHKTRVNDSLHWMALEDESNRFIQHLSAENKYAENILYWKQKRSSPMKPVTLSPFIPNTTIANSL